MCVCNRLQIYRNVYSGLYNGYWHWYESKLQVCVYIIVPLHRYERNLVSELDVVDCSESMSLSNVSRICGNLTTNNRLSTIAKVRLFLMFGTKHTSCVKNGDHHLSLFSCKEIVKKKEKRMKEFQLRNYITSNGRNRMITMKFVICYEINDNKEYGIVTIGVTCYIPCITANYTSMLSLLL